MWLLFRQVISLVWDKPGLNKDDDVVEGIVVMRKGENPREVLARVKEKIKELNEKILPSDVKDGHLL